MSDSIAQQVLYELRNISQALQNLNEFLQAVRDGRVTIQTVEKKSPYN